MTPKEQAERIWRLVVDQPLGLKARPVDGGVNLLHNQLLEVRLETSDPELFQFNLQVKAGEIWIVRSKGLPEVRVDGAFQPLEE